MKKVFFRLIIKLFGKKIVLVGVPVIIQNSKKEILLGKRKKNCVCYPGFWGLPGGLPEYGESLKGSAIREVKEELGVDIKIIEKSKEVYEVPGTKECDMQAINIVFYGKIIKGKIAPKDETSEVKWFKLSEIKKMKLAYGHKKILRGEGLVK